MVEAEEARARADEQKRALEAGAEGGRGASASSELFYMQLNTACAGAYETNWSWEVRITNAQQEPAAEPLGSQWPRTASSYPSLMRLVVSRRRVKRRGWHKKMSLSTDTGKRGTTYRFAALHLLSPA